MKTIMARSPHESSFSFSKRHFQWITGKGSAGDQSLRMISAQDLHHDEEDEEDTKAPTFSTTTASSKSCGGDDAPSKKRPAPALSRFRMALVAAVAGRARAGGLGPRVTGTLFGHRRGHVRVAFQADPRARPAALVELAAPTSALVREMASGLVRVALECERGAGGPTRLLDERLWRAYCNGRKCGFAVRRECGPADWEVLRAVGPVSMGAGVLPAPADSGEGEMMYMRARFERVVGSKDSEAFYMLSPDGNGGPELSIYFLRV